MSAFSSAIETPLAAGGVARSGGGHDAASPTARAEGVELLGRPGGSGHRRPPSLVRRADGQTVQLTPLLYGLLETIDGERGDDELAGVLGEKIGKQVTGDDVRFLIDGKLRPLGLLQHPDGTAPVTAAPSPLLALRMKLVVSNPATTRRITALFAWLFQPVIVAAMVAAFALTIWWLAFEKGLGSAAHELLYRPGLVLVVLGLTFLSAAFHEVGHAAACRYGGARPGAMGVGLYLLWPAFYTDVTDSYRLGRGGRLRVDLGGLYFNAIFAVATLGVWALERSDALLLVIAAQVVLMARQLVPFVRFDGYHILADLVGVPDLFMHIKPTLLGLLPTRRRRVNGNPLKRWVRVVVTLWVVLVVPLLMTFLALMIVAMPRVLGTAWASLGKQGHDLAVSWAAADAPAVTARLLSILLICLPIAGSVYLLTRVGRRAVRNVLRATKGKPLLRAGAALAAAALGALLAWAWWPGESYRPIGPQDDGVLALPHLEIPPREQVAAVEPAVYAPASKPPVAQRPVRPVAGVQPVRRRETGHAQWMIVLLPKRDARAVARPTVSLPPPQATEAAGAPPTVTPVGSPAKTTVTVVPRTKSGWVFPFAPPPKPGPRDNQAVAVNTTDGATNYVVALSLVWVTDGGPVDERNQAWALASCTGCTTVAVAFQAVFVVGYAQVDTPVNTAVAFNYDCTTCATGALAQQLAVTLARKPSDAAMEEIAAVWSELQQASESFELEPLAQVQEQLNATRSQLLDILARDDALPPAPAPATTTTTPTTTTAATTTAPPPTTTAPTTTDSTTPEAATTQPTTTTDTTTTDTTTTEPVTTDTTTTTPTTTTPETTTTTTETTTTDQTTTTPEP